MLAWGMVQRMRAPDEEAAPRRPPTSPATQLRIVPPEMVAMESVQLSGGGAPFELRGRILNRSKELQLKSVTIRVTRRDCHEAALDPSGCALLWEDRHWMPLTVPPQEQREFSASIWMRGSAPRPRGEIRDSFELVGAMGEATAVER